MTAPGLLTRPRGWAIGGGAFLLLFLLLSFRHVPDQGEVVVLDSPILKTRVRVLPPGWHFVPVGLRGVYRYPESQRQLDLLLDESHGRSLRARDGVAVGVDLQVRYSLTSDHVLDVHRMRGPGYEEEWLIPEIVAATREVLERNTFAEVEGRNRFRLERALDFTLSRVLGDAGFRLDEVRVFRLGEGNLPPSIGREDLAAIPGSSILFIGMDSADWTILDPLLEQGRLPNFARLIEGGVRARLRTISPVLSPVIWTTVATGKMPEKHGIVDFLAVDSRTGKKVPVTSNLRRTKAMWNILSDAHVPVGVIAWWASWPAEEVDGFLVSDRISYQLFGMGDLVEASDEGKVHPASLMPEIDELRVRPEEIGPTELARFLHLPTEAGALSEDDRERVKEFQTVLAGTRTYEAIAHRFFRDRPAPFQAVYFEALDTTSHLFMQFRPPRHSIVSEEQVAWFGDAVDRIYEYQDEILGRLLEEFGGEEVNVVIASDHGFRSGENRPAEDARIGAGKAAEWHRRYGVLILNGPAFREGASLEQSSVVDVAPTMLAALGLPRGDDMDGEVLTGAFRPEFLEAHPVGSIRTYDDPEGEEPEAAPIPSSADDEIMAKLTALGYLSAPADPGAGYLSQAGSNSANNRGVLELNRGRFREAIEEFRAALEEDPGFLAARVNMGRAYMLMGNADEALRAFEDVLKLDPEAQEVENFVGNIYMEQGEHEKAEAHFRRAVEIEPNYTDGHNSLGILFERVDRLQEAVEEYETVVRYDPDSGEGYNNLGNVLKKMGDLEQAEQMYRRAMEADPSFVGSFNNLALLYQDRGDIDGAIEYYRMALKKAPDHPQVRLNLGSLYYAQGRIEEAKEEFIRAIELNPQFADAHNNLGAVYGALGDHESELRELQAAVALRPDYADARHNLGLAFLRAGQDERGIEQLSRAVEVEPNYVSALVNLGMALSRRGRHQVGVPYLERALGLQPRMPAVLNALGNSYLQMGRREEGISRLQASLALEPNQPNIRQLLASVGAG